MLTNTHNWLATCTLKNSTQRKSFLYLFKELDSGELEPIATRLLRWGRVLFGPLNVQIFQNCSFFLNFEKKFAVFCFFFFFLFCKMWQQVPSLTRKDFLGTFVMSSSFCTKQWQPSKFSNRRNSKWLTNGRLPWAGFLLWNIQTKCLVIMKKCLAKCTDRPFTFLTLKWQQVRFVSVKAERPYHPSRCHARQPVGVVSGGGPPRQWQWWHIHESIRLFRLTVALGLKIDASTTKERVHWKMLLGTLCWHNVPIRVPSFLLNFSNFTNFPQREHIWYFTWFQIRWDPCSFSLPKSKLKLRSENQTKSSQQCKTDWNINCKFVRT